ncbi:MAG: ATP-dependent zinc metalloprotease FtsH [Candidatus Cryptobacteroides sp.]|nr:ATP-dependent zinc metalloprotease FtsH [Bacteroidales bacterium]MDY5459339.1 ATP-dependent zinc metalloprotease FtsH [Candidatus Cryptobacteroides sp.]
MNKKKKVKVVRLNLSWLYLLLVGGIFYLLFKDGAAANPQKTEWATVREMALAGDVKEVDFVRNEYKGLVTLKGESLEKYASDFGGKVPVRSPHYIFLATDHFDVEKEVASLNAGLEKENQIKLVISQGNNFWSNIMDWIFPLVLIILMYVMMFRAFRPMGGQGGQGGGGGFNPFNVGKAQGKLADKDKVDVTFKDVAGLYGAKEEVMEIVDFLKNPKKYTDLGAKIPKGALLVGPPGNGKTLLAKAVAGEANVPFFSMSGSDFVEMFVGVGASRVRDLFAQAKEKAPCIVFIDEIDAVGRARGKNAGFSGNDERENTLNQLLTEMDGFGSNSGVIVLAATNRADILDKALMRAGRFDRQIHVDLPELKEREEIFKVHIRDLKISKDFDVSYMAKHTAGFSGADIANVCNEAALGAARKNKSEIDLQDFLDAVDRIVGGIVKKGYLLSDSEKKTIAHHEAGHAVVSWLLPHANQLFKVTLVPRGNALGAAWYLPDEHKIERKSQMIDEMCSLIGGRVAEEILNGEPSTGAQNDLERLTKTAYSMIQNYGMSEVFGNFSFYDSTGSRAYDFTRPYSEKTAELLDAEVSKLVKEVHDKTYKILKDHEQEWREIANELLTKEVIFADDVQAILGPKVKDAQDELKEQDDTVSQA